MRRSVRNATFALVLAFAVHAQAAEVVRVAPWELHSSFWLSLHQTLVDEAMRETPRELTGLSAEEQATWKAAVAAYRAAGGGGDFAFVTLIARNDVITQLADDAAAPAIASFGDALRKAAPVYRKHWWVGDDKANRFFIGYASAMLRDAGKELIGAHETAYRTASPQRVRVYVTPYAGKYGAFTMSGDYGVITTMSSRDARNQGHSALEIVLQETSSGMITANRGPVAAAIAAASKKRSIEPPRDLWNALRFATTSELTRRALAERGVAKFAGSGDELMTRLWPKYREPIEKHWFPYLGGQGTLEEAVDRVVEAIQ